MIDESAQFYSIMFVFPVTDEGLTSTHLGFEKLPVNHYSCYRKGCNFFLDWINGRKYSYDSWLTGTSRRTWLSPIIY